MNWWENVPHMKGYERPQLVKLPGWNFLAWEIRFWHQIDKDGPIHPEHGQCWQWIGYTLGGYGKIRVNRDQKLSHRVSYEYHVGEIPKGLKVLHSCDNPGCVNPDHLRLGTDADNNRDKEERGRGNHPSTPWDYDRKRRVSEKMKGRRATKKIRAKQSDSQNQRFSRPEEIDKLKAASKRRWDRYRAQKEKK